MVEDQGEDSKLGEKMKINYGKIDRLYKQGKSYAEIADELDLSVIDVIRYLEKLKVTEKNISLEERTSNRNDVISDLYIRGKSLEEISTFLGISVDLVKEELLSMGVHYSLDRVKGIEILSKRSEIKRRIALRESKYGIEIRRREVARLHDEGKKGKEIAETLGISFDTVLKDITYLIQNGVIETKRTIRRKEVIRLYKEGKSIKEISEELRVSVPTIRKDIEYLIANGFIKQQDGEEKSKKEILEDRRERVLVLYGQGKNLREMAQELGVSTTTVYNDVSYLKRNGRIEGKEEKPKMEKINKREEKVNERREKVAILYNKGESVEQISKRLGEPISTVYDDITYLGENGIIQLRTDDKKQKISERRNRIAKLYKSGKTLKDIANELGVSTSTVNSDIQYLRENGIIQLRTGNKESEATERREKVAKLYNSGKTLKEIAQEVGISISTVHADVKYLRKEGIVEKRNTLDEQIEERITERRGKVAKLYNSGKSLKEIANELGISTSTLHLDLQYLNTKGIIQLKSKQEGQTINKRRNQVAILYNEGKTPKEIAQELGITIAVAKNDINYLKARRIIVVRRDKTRNPSAKSENDGTQTKEKTDSEVMEKMAQKKYYSMMIKSIMEFYKSGDIENAIKYLEMLESEVDFQGEEKEKIEEIMRILQSKRGQPERKDKSEKQNREERVFEERVANLYYSKKSVQEIAKILETSPENIEAKIAELKEKGLIQEDREDEER